MSGGRDEDVIGNAFMIGHRPAVDLGLRKERREIVRRIPPALGGQIAEIVGEDLDGICLLYTSRCV